jgi:tyrosine-protein kinase Etk/Wzc
VLSQELANTHVATFARTSQIVRFEPSPEQAAFLAQELATQEARLVQAEAALQQFRQAHPDITPASKDNLAAQRLLQTQQRFTTAQAKRIEAALLSHITREKEATQLVTLIKSDRLTHLRAAFNRLEVEHTRLTGLLASSHPRLSELANTKEAARQQLEQELAALVATLETEYTAARNAEAVLQEEAAQQRKTALDRGEFAVVTAALNADIASVQTLVHTVRKRQQDRALLKALPDPNITVTTLAEVPLTPTSPQPMRDFLLAFLGGTIAAVSLAFFLEWTDTSVRTAQDVWQATTYPLLGVIPPRAAQLEAIVQLSQQAHRRSLQGQDELVADVSSDIFTEQTAIQDLVDESYHLLSTRLPIGQKQSPRTFLFTSPYADDDKTSTLLSLAVTLAGQGYKVVVVDADLRTGHCHTLLQKDQSIGLSEVLRDGAAFVSSRRHTRKRRTENHSEVNSSAFELSQDEHANGTQRTRSSPKLKALVESAIQTTTIDGLSLIACGQAPLTPEGQLGSDTLPEVLDVLRRKFTCVLIDSPAAMTSGDAELLAQLSNATILVLRGYKTPMAAAYRVAGQLQVVRAKVLGVVLTNVNPHAIDLLEHR